MTETEPRLKVSANNLMKVIGTSEERAKSVLPFIDSVLRSVQSGANSVSVQGTAGLGLTKERIRIALRLNGFNPKDNVVTKEFEKRFGPNLKQSELRNIAQIIADHANIKLDRDAKRRKNVLLKWFDEHWTQIAPFLNNVVLDDAQGNKDQSAEQQEA